MSRRVPSYRRQKAKHGHDLAFVEALDPEVSVVSNRTEYGHPTHGVAQRLIDLGSQFYQTNVNPNDRAHHPLAKYVGDNTFNEDDEDEDAEGALGTIAIVVDPEVDKYYVVVFGLPLDEATLGLSTEHAACVAGSSA